MTQYVKEYFKKTTATYSLYVDGKTVLKTDELSEILNRWPEFIAGRTLFGLFGRRLGER